MKPFFSLIVPTFNQPEYILESLNGLLSQTFKDFEIIILDDSNNCQTRELISQIHDPRLFYIKNPKNQGRVNNYRNGILKHAKGNWALICDGDDFIFDNQYLEIVYSKIFKYPNLVLIQAGQYKGVDILSGVVEVPNIPTEEIYLSGESYFENFEEIGHFSHLSTITRLDLLQKVNPFYLNILSSDIETYLKVSFHGDVLLIRKPVGLWRQHEFNISKNPPFLSKLYNLDWILSSGEYWFEKSESKNIKSVYLKRFLNGFYYLLRQYYRKGIKELFINNLNIFYFLVKRKLVFQVFFSSKFWFSYLRFLKGSL